ncbi:asparaginase [archaeon SCG-AAA382B04]|nr:asparaginase [archaeon SCG-AAA382B04]
MSTLEQAIGSSDPSERRGLHFYKNKFSSSLKMYSIIVHGGAGEHKNTKEAKKGVIRAVKKGENTLKECKNPIKSVEESIKVLEEDINFNAGRGSVLTKKGEIKMDASIANSKKEIGAVANITDIKHPISLAKKIMKNKDHLLLGGKQATKHAIELGLETSNPYTKKRIKEWQEKKEQKNPPYSLSDTVGAVAINNKGKIAAGTSTGGKSLKQDGRIGDSPLFGAGTYVNKDIGASATGTGEGIIKSLLTSKVYEKYNKEKNLRKAIKKSIEEHTKHISKKINSCGVIAIDKKYNISFNKNTTHLPVAYTKEGEEISSNL